MEPVTPNLAMKPQGTQQVVFGEGQGDYIPLPTEVTRDQKVVSRWQPTEEERARLIAGLDVYVTVMTFGNDCRHCGKKQGLQPLMVTIGPPDLD
jgi:hypothetical protein